MGYSVYVEFKDEKSKDKMLAFMKQNYRELDTMVGFELITATAATLDDDLSYANKKHIHIVGFDYQSWVDAYERNYLNAITRWMALNSGCERPCIVYDGCENMWLTDVDEHGYREFKPYGSFVKENVARVYNTLLEQELMCFTERWEDWKKKQKI